MIHTLTTSGFLYQVYRHRETYQDFLDRRRAFWFVAIISAVLTFGVIAFILQT